MGFVVWPLFLASQQVGLDQNWLVIIYDRDVLKKHDGIIQQFGQDR